MHFIKRLFALSAAVLFAIDLYIPFRLTKQIKTELKLANGVLTRALAQKIKRAISISVTLVILATILSLIADFLPDS